MGDIGTHKSIYENIKPTLQTDVDDERAFYFELGNWFADVSQFYDPPAYYAAKQRSWGMVSEGQWEFLLKLVDIDGYLDALWGSEDLETRSAFGRWIEQLIFASGLEWVRPKSREQMQRCVGLGMTPTEGSVDPTVYGTLFDRLWTQYYPHEHLDFPPILPGETLYGARLRLSYYGIHHCTTTQSGGPKRRVPMYLERQLNFVSERLQEVESLAAQLREMEQLTEQITRYSDMVLLAQQRSPEIEAEKMELYRRALTTLGRASHAIEDFFFHSNFVELVTYTELCDRFRTMYPNFGDVSNEKLFYQSSYWRWLDSAKPEWTVRTKRTFCRRLLQFAGVGDELKPDRDVSFSTYCYTGSFGANDIFHTFYDALIGMETQVSPLLTVLSVDDSNDQNRIEPFEYIFVEQKRRELSNPAVRNAALEVHWDRCDSGWYTDRIDEYVRAGCLHPLSGDALKEAIRIDTALRDAYNWAEEDVGNEDIDTAPEEIKNQGNLDAQRLGVMGFLYRLMDLVQSEHDASEERRRKFDQAKIVYELDAENGASKENVSSHSLMAKDSKEKEGDQKPFREDAIVLATFVAQYLVSLSMKQLRGEISHRINWEHILRHFVAHPGEAERIGGRDIWYRRALTGESPPVNEVLDFLEKEELVDYYGRQAVHLRKRANKSPWPLKRALEAEYDEHRKAQHEAWKKLLD